VLLLICGLYIYNPNFSWFTWSYLTGASEQSCNLQHSIVRTVTKSRTHRFTDDCPLGRGPMMDTTYSIYEQLLRICQMSFRARLWSRLVQRFLPCLNFMSLRRANYIAIQILEETVRWSLVYPTFIAHLCHMRQSLVSSLSFSSFRIHVVKCDKPCLG